MIYDCFTFFNELDLLELRLNVLNSVVDKFVIVEATKTHQFKDKELFFDKNKERFKEFESKIIHIVVDKYPDFWTNFRKPTTWDYENHQRNQINKGLKACKRKDVVIVSDLDEIPKPEKVLEFKDVKGVKIFEHYLSQFYFNYRLSKSYQKDPIVNREGDDYWTDPNKLQKQVDFLEVNLDYNVCFHDVDVVLDEYLEDKYKIHYELKYVDGKTSYTFEDLLIVGNIMHTPTVVFRNLVLDFPFVTAFTADYFLHLQNGFYGKIKRLPEKMAVYRVHRGGVFSHFKFWSIYQKKQFYENQILAFEELKKKYCDSKYRKLIVNQKLWQLNNNLRFVYLNIGEFSLSKKKSQYLFLNIKYSEKFSFKILYSLIFNLLFVKKISERVINSNHQTVFINNVDKEINLSVVIVNYKTPQLTKSCIESVYRTTNLNVEIIVVDNCSNDDSKGLITSCFSDVIWIQNKENLGFSNATNLGIINCKSSNILVLNSDVILQDKTLDFCLNELNNDAKLGIVTCKLLNSDLSKQASEFAIGKLSDMWHKNLIVEKLIKKRVYEKIGVIGAFMMFSRETLRKVGSFDEDFFMYSEDTEICFRILDAGYKIRLYDEVSAIHLSGASTKNKKWANKQKIASHALMVYKTKGFIGYCSFHLIMFINIFSNIFAMFLLDKKYRKDYLEEVYCYFSVFNYYISIPFNYSRSSKGRKSLKVKG